jgi:hypothetical protein
MGNKILARDRRFLVSRADPESLVYLYEGCDITARGCDLCLLASLLNDRQRKELRDGA